MEHFNITVGGGEGWFCSVCGNRTDNKPDTVCSGTKRVIQPELLQKFLKDEYDLEWDLSVIEEFLKRPRLGPPVKQFVDNDKVKKILSEKNYELYCCYPQHNKKYYRTFYDMVGDMSSQRYLVGFKDYFADFKVSVPCGGTEFKMEKREGTKIFNMDGKTLDMWSKLTKAS